MEYLSQLAVSLALTSVIELLFSRCFHVGKRGLLIVLLVNILTNPAVNYCCILLRFVLSGVWYYLVQILLECLVVLVEGVVYLKASKSVSSIKRPFFMSFVLNVLSYGIGILLNIGVRFLC